MRKSISRGISVALLSLLFVLGTEQKSRAQDVTVSYQTFYDNLSPYGQWVSDPQYGNVWVPNEGGDFRPYGSRGHWVMTDYGNTWVSEDPWGWACYHYGRWTYDNYYGWVWVPGYEWAPAWVSWRYGGGYSGWAPLGPGISIGISYNCPESWWVFVQPQYMYSNDCYRHWRGPAYNGGYLRQTTVVNNYYMDNGTRVRYNYGPRADVIQRDTRQPVQVYHVSQMRNPGAPVVQNNRVSIYRPNVNRATQSTARPSNVVQAPRQIGRPQAANNVSAARQPEFRQHMQRQGGQAPAQNAGAVNPREQRGNNNQPNNRVQPQQGRPQGQPQNQNRPEQQGRPQGQLQNQNRVDPQNRQEPQGRPQQQGRPDLQSRPEPQSRPQPGRFQSEPQRSQPQVQPQSRPEPMRQQQQEPMRQQPQSRPEPARQQQNRPEPMRQQPQSRPEPMRQQPQMQPQNRPEPMRQQPQMQPQNRPEPMRQQPQGRPEQRQEAPHPGGGRR